MHTLHLCMKIKFRSKYACKLSVGPVSGYLVQSVVQVDNASLKEVCSEYGRVLRCMVDIHSETALVQYNSVDEAMQAKAGLDKNPTICDVTVVPDFASRRDVDILSDLGGQQVESTLSGREALEETTPSWFTDTEDVPPDSVSLPPSSSSSSHSPAIGGGKWRQPVSLSSGASVHPSFNQAALTTGAPTAVSMSPWGGGAEFLPGLSSPWHTNLGGSGKPEAREELPALGSTFLKNGLM